MAYYMVPCERIKEGHGKVTWDVHVQANSASEARSIAKEKAKMQYPDFRIAVGTARQV